MAKKTTIEKEKKRQNLVEKYKGKRQSLLSEIRTLRSSVVEDNTNNYETMLGLQGKLQKLPRNSSVVRLRNRCWVTGRGRGYYRDFGLSRHVLREMSHDCLVPGVTKSSW